MCESDLKANRNHGTFSVNNSSYTMKSISLRAERIQKQYRLFCYYISENSVHIYLASLRFNSTIYTNRNKIVLKR